MTGALPRLSRRQLIAYSLPAIPLAALHSPITVYLPPFFGTEMGLGLTAVGAVFLFARLWDIFTDPVLGVATDRLPSRWGRRRHWIVMSVPVLMISVAMLFLPRELSGPSVSATYLVGWLMVLYVGYTVAALSQYSWAAELTDVYDERSRVLGWREFFHLFGMLAVLSLPAAIELYYGGTSLGDKVAVMGVFFLVMLPLTVAVAVTVVPEYPHRKAHQAGIGEGLRLLFGSGPMRRVLLTDLMVGIPGGVMGSLYVFFANDVIGAGPWLTVILLGFFGAGLLGIPLLVRTSYRLEKHNAIILCKGAMLVVTLSFLFLDRGDVLAFALLIVLTGLIFNGLHVMLRAITADIVDRDLLDTGAVRTGLYFALLTMTNKVGYALALLTYPLLDALGFQAGGSADTTSIDVLRYLFVGVPVLSLVVGMALMWRFPYGRAEHEQVRLQLAARRESQDRSASVAVSPNPVSP
jgi:Na+/melibiose symporter-like transporter